MKWMSPANQRLWKRSFLFALIWAAIYMVVRWEPLIPIGLVLGGLYVAVRYLREEEQ
jgi:hypothetical protein